MNDEKNISVSKRITVPITAHCTVFPIGLLTISAKVNFISRFFIDDKNIRSHFCFQFPHQTHIGSRGGMSSGDVCLPAVDDSLRKKLIDPIQCEWSANFCFVVYHWFVYHFEACMDGEIFSVQLLPLSAYMNLYLERVIFFFFVNEK